MSQIKPLHTAFVFGIAGPPVGGTAAVLYFLRDTSGSLADYFDPLSVLIYLVSAAACYIIGFFPAALAGFTFGLTLKKAYQSHYPGYFLCAVAGTVIGFLSTFVLLYAWFLFAQTSVLTAAEIGSLGAAAGCICGLLAKCTAAGSNKSFKPNPLRGSA
jgi:hypothetical protein